MADAYAPIIARTKTAGDVVVKIVDSAGTNLAAVDSSGRFTVNVNGTVTVSGTVTANAGTGFPPVVTDGSAAGSTGVHVLGTDGTNAQIISTNASGHVNIADGGNTITVDGTVGVSGSVDTELPAASSLADNTANPSAPAVGAFLMGYDGSTWDRVRVNGSGELVVTTSTTAPTLPTVDTVTSASLAAGASVNLDSTAIASTKTGKLTKLVVAASIPLKIEVQTVLNGSATTRIVAFTTASDPTFTFDTPHKDYIIQAESATAGFDGFRVRVTNRDDTLAADVYATIFYDVV